MLDLYRNSASPATNDLIGEVTFSGQNTTPAKATYALIETQIDDATASSEDATLLFKTATAGSLVTNLSVNSTGVAANGNVLSSPIVGSMRNGKMSVTAASASATFTADEIIVGAALNGSAKRLSSYSQAINLATTGAGGMDTGSAPVSGFVSLYAIAKPDGTTSILACSQSTIS